MSIRARSVPSLQLAGSAERRTVDLNALTGIGVQLVGRLVGIRDGKAQFSGSLRNQCALADLKMNRLLDTIDQWASENGLDDKVGPAAPLRTHRVDASPPLGIDLTSGEIRTIIWATGYRPTTRGSTCRSRPARAASATTAGVVEAPGMYLLACRSSGGAKSSLIDGAGDDARDLSAHLASYLRNRTSVTRLKRQVLSR